MPSSKGIEKTLLSGRLCKIVPDGDEKRASWYIKTPKGEEVYLMVIGWSRAKYNEHTDKRLNCEGEWRGASFLATKIQENPHGG